jgi:hypothetical protein
MNIHVYAMRLIGANPLEKYESPSYSDLIHSHSKIIQYFLSRGFVTIDGVFSTVPSKGIPFMIRETLSLDKVLLDVYVHLDKERDRTLLDIGIATTSPERIKDLEALINHGSEIRIKLYPKFEILNKLNLDLFRKTYESILQGVEKGQTAVTG